MFSTNFRPKTKKIVRALLKKNIKVSDLGLIWRPFREYLQIKNFFKNPALWLFYLYSPLTSCKKSEKSLEPFLRKLHYQPTNYYQQHWFYRTSLTPVQKKYEKKQPPEVLATLQKKGLWRRCFLVSFVKFLRTAFFIITSGGYFFMVQNNRAEGKTLLTLLILHIEIIGVFLFLFLFFRGSSENWIDDKTLNRWKLRSQGIK